MNNQIRVLIADANEGFTAQLSGFLGENPAFVVAGVQTTAKRPWSCCIPCRQIC